MKLVLIITYYWPPSGGGGVQRWLKFTKYLPQTGWKPIIFTPENPDFNIRDNTLQKDVPDEAEVLKFPIWEPYRLFDRLSSKSKPPRQQGIVGEGSKRSFFTEISKWIRGNLFIPDPKIFWIRSSVDFLVDFIRDRSISHVITTGPPHSMHLIGLKLKRKTGISWIADFRDPWVRWDLLKQFHLSLPAKKIHRRMESAVMKHADIILTVSQSWAQQIEKDHKKKVEVITNGYDHEDHISKSVWNKEKFIISHSGLINDLRNPETLWRALSELCQEDTEFNDRLQLEFCGMIEQAVLHQIRSYPLVYEKFIFKHYLTHDEVMELYGSSSVLLLLLNQSENSKGHLPGKLFEYLAANRYILALGDTQGDAEKILSKTQSGLTVGYEDINGLKNALTSFFTHFKNGNFPEYKAIEEFSRKTLTARLTEILEQL